MRNNFRLFQHPQRICEEHVRSQLLDRIPSDAAYQIQPKVSEWVMEDEQNGPLKLCVEINCERSKFARMILKVILPARLTCANVYLILLIVGGIRYRIQHERAIANAIQSACGVSLGCPLQGKVRGDRQ